MIRIFMVDDHAVVREGLRLVLADVPGMQVVGEAGNGHEALERLRTVACDVLLLDLSMPGRGGLETLREARERWPALKILVFSMHPEDQFAIRVLKEGARGYITKETPPSELVKVIQKIAAGGTWVSAAVTERMVQVIGGAGEEPHEKLSSREFEVMRMLAQGKTVSQIAAQLFLSVKTVSTYRTRILEKLALSNTAELMHYAIDKKLTE
jgi:two-component system invasion response regulator UvrY